MNKTNLALLIGLIISLTFNIYTCIASLNKTHENNENIPWPGMAIWNKIEHDSSIKILKSKSNDLPLIEYNIHDKTIALRGIFDDVIAWKDGEDLMIVTFGSISNGCALTKVDIKKKKILYYVDLVGIGLVDHSQYGNNVLVFRNGNLIMIVGDESAGNYREIRRASDGSLISIEQQYKNFNRPPFISIK